MIRRTPSSVLNFVRIVFSISLKLLPFIRRIISYFRFAVKLFIHRKQFEKPDVIIHTSRIPFDIPIYQLAKKVKAKYIVDVTDLWPDSFVSLGLLGKNNPCVKIAYCLERYIYSKADNVVFSMPGAVNYVRENGWDSDQGGTDRKSVV